MTFQDQLTRKIDELAGSEAFSGAVLIQQHGKDIFTKAVGYAHRGWQIPNAINTRFRVASISKMFTAVAILQLVGKGKLSTDSLVVELLDLQDSTLSPDITIEHLLTMTAGIADWFEEEGDWETNWDNLRRENPLYFLRTLSDYLPLFIHKPPDNPVGEIHKYSNASYVLLGLAIEKLSGLNYFDYVRQNIITPLGLSGTDFIAIEDIQANVAEGYMQDKNGKWLKNIYHVTPEASADGGATATVHDLATFARALREGKFLSQSSTQAMLSPKVSISDEKQGDYWWEYGYAHFFLLGDDKRVIRHGHTGEEDGISGRLYYYPEFDIDVVILGNQSMCTGALSWYIHDLVMATVW